MSKGSSRRPSGVDSESFANRWERTFGNSEPTRRDAAEDAVWITCGPRKIQVVLPAAPKYDVPPGLEAILRATYPVAL